MLKHTFPPYFPAGPAALYFTIIYKLPAAYNYYKQKEGTLALSVA